MSASLRAGVPPRFLPRLAKLGIRTVRDLLWHFPVRYEDYSRVYPIAELQPNQHATVCGVVESVESRRSFRRRMTITQARITDETETVTALWFNQPYVQTTLHQGEKFNFSGRVSDRDGMLVLMNPAFERAGSAPRHTAGVIPVYRETRGLTSRGLRYLIHPILSRAAVSEFLPPAILREHALRGIGDALRAIHAPRTTDDAADARRRFAFEDLFLLHLFNMRQKSALSRARAHAIPSDVEAVRQFLSHLPFQLTLTQKNALWEILQDMERPHPMNRLLQGDVGSGKTIVAAIAALIAGRAGLQTAFMAPTEILALQHFETLTRLFEAAPEFSLPVCLLTGKRATAYYEPHLFDAVSKTTLAKRIRAGGFSIVVGTHTLISSAQTNADGHADKRRQSAVQFHSLGLVVVDEQHRFGVNQRQALSRGQTQTDTQMDADTDTRTHADNDLVYADVTYKIRGAIFSVQKNIGPGHKEVIYQRALQEELRNIGLSFETEKNINVIYGGKKIGAYRPDFIVEDKILIELKALPFIGKIEEKQTWNYLKGSQYRVALLVNFSPEKATIKRIVYDTARGPRMSASSPRGSAFLPHFLSMSATPIPRTIMMTAFGDLDISTITELPRGRRPIVTKVVEPNGRAEAYAFIRGRIRDGRQAFVICPRIEPPEDASEEDARALDVKNVTDEYETLARDVFPDCSVAMLHGKMKAGEKESVMRSFKENRSQILISTSVVEVGVDVPNATIMAIEGAERFGLAQLYQFRGRVGRGEHQSHCFLFVTNPAKGGASGGASTMRLHALIDAKNGFELAEKDLEIRGPGEFLGQKQAGMPDFPMRNMMNTELIKQSRDAAARLLSADPDLRNTPDLRARVASFGARVHLE